MSRYDTLEAKIATEVGRNIGELAYTTKGTFEKTVTALEACKNVRIVTGFFIPKAAAAETDGPPGAGLIGYALDMTRSRNVKFVTDLRCHKTLVAAIEPFGFNIGDVELVQDRDQVQALIPKWQGEKVDGLLSIERPGPGFDGIMRNMNAEPLQMYALDLAPLFRCVSWLSFGVGDGGNEIGMGKVPWPIIEKVIKYGDKIACSTKVDHLVVAGVSNWGGAGLAAALLARANMLESSLRLDLLHEESVRAMVALGACDGKTLQKAATVDGLPLDQHSAIIQEITNLALEAHDVDQVPRT